MIITSHRWGVLFFQFPGHDSTVIWGPVLFVLLRQVWWLRLRPILALVHMALAIALAVVWGRRRPKDPQVRLGNSSCTQKCQAFKRLRAATKKQMKFWSLPLQWVESFCFHLWSVLQICNISIWNFEENRKYRNTGNTAWLQGKASLRRILLIILFSLIRMWVLFDIIIISFLCY